MKSGTPAPDRSTPDQCVCFQEAGSIHAAADPSVRDPLHGLRLLPREREQEGASGVWTGARVLPGEQNAVTPALDSRPNFPTQPGFSHSDIRAKVSKRLLQVCWCICVFVSCLRLLMSPGLRGRRPLLFPEWRGKPPLNNNSRLHLCII